MVIQLPICARHLSRTTRPPGRMETDTGARSIMLLVRSPKAAPSRSPHRFFSAQSVPIVCFKSQARLFCKGCNATVLTPELRTGPDGPRTLCNKCAAASFAFFVHLTTPFPQVWYPVRAAAERAVPRAEAHGREAPTELSPLHPRADGVAGRPLMRVT